MSDYLEPNAVVFEKALLGSLVYDPDAYYLVQGLVGPDDFFIERHGWIFHAFEELAAEKAPIDYLTVCDRLEKRNRLKALGGRVYVSSLVTQTPTSNHVEYYACQVRRYALVRRMIKDAGRLARLAYYRQPVEEILTTARKILQDLQEAIELALTTKKGESRANEKTIDIGDC